MVKLLQVTIKGLGTYLNFKKITYPTQYIQPNGIRHSNSGDTEHENDELDGVLVELEYKWFGKQNASNHFSFCCIKASAHNLSQNLKDKKIKHMFISKLLITFICMNYLIVAIEASLYNMRAREQCMPLVSFRRIHL